MLRHRDARAVPYELIAERREHGTAALRRRFPASAAIADASPSVASGIAEIKSPSDRPSGAMGFADAPFDGRARSGRSPNRSSCKKPDMFRTRKERTVYRPPWWPTTGALRDRMSAGAGSSHLRLRASRLRLRFPASRSVSALALLRLANFDGRVLGDEFLGNESDSHTPSGMHAEQPAELPERQPLVVDMDGAFPVRPTFVDEAAQHVAARDPLIAVLVIVDLLLPRRPDRTASGAFRGRGTQTSATDLPCPICELKTGLSMR